MGGGSVEDEGGRYHREDTRKEGNRDLLLPFRHLQTFSITVAMPCPTPMHIVHKA